MSVILSRIFGGLGFPEIAIIAVIILLIFGARRLPEIGSSMGKGIRTFKNALTGEDEKPPQETPPATKGNDDGRPY
jgi:sec-independent protein translocase protein TatA